MIFFGYLKTGWGMRILGVDTSTAIVSTAIVDNAQIVAEDFYLRELRAGRSAPGRLVTQKSFYR